MLVGRIESPTHASPGGGNKENKDIDRTCLREAGEEDKGVRKEGAARDRGWAYLTLSLSTLL